MLPFVLVLFVATSALAAPSVIVNQVPINEIAPIPDNGRLVNRYVIDSAFESVDGGDTNIYILTIQQILNDLASQPDVDSLAIAVGTAIATLGELATGIAGDACEYANLINAFANGRGSSALNGWANRILNAIDNIVLLNTNPEAVRGAVGARGNCVGGGRSYRFEEAWDKIFSSTNSNTVSLINDEYCASKRLYRALNNRSNNVGAAVTATATVPARAALQQALPQLAKFLRDVAGNVNPTRSAAIAKAALRGAVANVQAAGL